MVDDAENAFLVFFINAGAQRRIEVPESVADALPLVLVIPRFAINPPTLSERSSV